LCPPHPPPTTHHPLPITQRPGESAALIFEHPFSRVSRQATIAKPLIRLTDGITIDPNK
jgi:hypothetical protein